MSQGIPSSFSITPGKKTKRSQSNPLNSALQRGKNSTPKPNLQTNTNANPTVNEKGGLDLDFVENFATSTLNIPLITFTSGQECIFNLTVTKK